MKEFFKTYFYIETNYKWGIGHTEEQAKNFNEKISEMFKKLNWELKTECKNGVCATYKHDLSELYCHPMELSGVIDISLKDEIENTLKEVGIELRYTKIYDKYENISKEEVSNRVWQQQEQIEQELLQEFQTKRKNQYLPISVCDQVARNYYINTIGRTNNNLEDSIIYDILKQMKVKGLILNYPNNDRYCRALNKTELKQYFKNK